MAPTLEHEWELWAEGHGYVAGLDEVGRGCLAGPVVAGAVVLPCDLHACAALRTAGLRDSKKLSPARRQRLVPLIQEVALAVAIGEASAAEIDQIGIVAACCLAMERALEQMDCVVSALLLDAFPLTGDTRPQRPIVRGDDKCLSIAAASVVAKVYRDRLMEEYDREFPGYGFASNKGYAAPVHRQAIQSLGPTAIHRLTWQPLRALETRQLPLTEEPGGGKAGPG